jgi:hypothetical protein
MDFSRLIPGQDSIFYTLLIFSAGFYVIAESMALMKRRGISPAVSRGPNLKAPLGWALLPAIVLVSLTFVHWGKKAPLAGSSRFPVQFVSYGR